MLRKEPLMQLLSVINPFGLLFALLLALPPVVYRLRSKTAFTVVPNKGLRTLAAIGRFGSLFLMSVHLGIAEQGFTEPKELMRRFWLITTAVMICFYLLLWFLYAKNQSRRTAVATVILSAAVFIFSGILQVNTLLFTFGVVYLAGELMTVRHCT